MHAMFGRPIAEVIADECQALSQLAGVLSFLIVELFDGHRSHPYLHLHPSFTAVPAAVTISIEPPTVS